MAHSLAPGKSFVVAGHNGEEMEHSFFFFFLFLFGALIFSNARQPKEHPYPYSVDVQGKLAEP